MAGLAGINLTAKQIVWPGENQNVVNRYVAGPQGQVELIDTSGWDVGVSM